MAHNTSSAEREIRDAVVARFRELMPGARIIHASRRRARVVRYAAPNASALVIDDSFLWVDLYEHFYDGDLELGLRRVAANDNTRGGTA